MIGSISAPPLPVWNANPLQGYSANIKFSGTHLYTWVERCSVRIQCSNNTTQFAWAGLEPRPFDPETNTLTMRPRFLPKCLQTILLLYGILDAHVLFIENLSAQLF